MRIRRIRPSKVRFSADSVRSSFDRNSSYRGEKIGIILDRVIKGGYPYIKLFPLMSVFRIRNNYFSLDNQLLWIYKVAESLGVITEVLVEYHCDKSQYVRSLKPFSSKSYGFCIEISGNPDGTFWKGSFRFDGTKLMCFDNKVKIMECSIVNTHRE